MAYTCETCGKVMQSEGSFGLHQLTAHVAGSAPAPGAVPAGGQWAPPPPPRGAYAQYPDPYGRYGAPPRRKTNPAFVVIGAVGMAVALLIVGSLAAVTFLGTTKAKPAQVALVDPAAPPALPADFKSVSKPDDGFLIGLPNSFNEVPLTADAVAGAAGSLESTNPRLAQLLRSGATNIQSDRLFAIDMSSGDNEQVQRIVIDGAGTVDDIPPGTFTDEYRNAGATSTNESRVHLPAGDALKVDITMPSGRGDVTVTQHVLVRDSTVWILTHAQVSGADDSEATAVASTFGWTK